MKKITHLLVVPAISLMLVACGNDADNIAPTSESSKATTTIETPINNVIDCAQYPSADAQQFADEYLPDCKQWAQTSGYRDAVVLPMDTAAEKIKLASDPLTCPKLNAGNIGYYCIGLDRASK